MNFGAATALLVGLLVSAGVAAIAIGSGRVAPPTFTASGRGPRTRLDSRHATALIAGLTVLLLTRWVLAASAVTLLIAAWRRLTSDDGARNQRDQIEAIAKWLDDVRDVVRRSSVPLEDALEIAAERPPQPLAAPLGRFVRQRRHGVGLSDALLELSDDIAHPTADSAIATLLLVVDHGAGGARVHDTLDELSTAARSELAARREIDRTRRAYRRSMRRLVVLVVALITGLAVLSGDLLDPYRAPAGQVWLFVPIAVWAGALLWLRRLVRYDAAPRTRLRVAEVAT